MRVLGDDLIEYIAFDVRRRRIGVVYPRGRRVDSEGCYGGWHIGQIGRGFNLLLLVSPEAVR